MSEEFIESIVDDGTDALLTPNLNDEGTSPLISSGVSSSSPVKRKGKGGKPVQTTKIGSGAADYPCTYLNCKKVYKRLKGLENHIFIHKIQDASRFKPTKDAITPLVPGFIMNILKEIKEEPNQDKEKADLIEDLTKKTELQWSQFSEAISDLIIGSLVAVTKVMPANQFEDFLGQLMYKLNADNTFDKLSSFVVELVSDSLKKSKFVEMISLRLCMRLTEEVQLHIVKEMRRPLSTPLSSSSCNLPSLSQNEVDQLKVHLKNLMKQYFVKATSLAGAVWRARILCIRNRFMCNEDGDGVSERCVLDNTLWESGSVSLSESIVNFFVGVEMLIKTLHAETGKYAFDAVLNGLLEDRSLLNAWHALIFGYLSEVDSLLFMKELVSIYVTLSIRLEEKRLQRLEDAKTKLAKFSLRGNLQRN